MSRQPQRLALSALLALCASGFAFADDNSMSMWTGDSYAYFNNQDYSLGKFNVARARRAADEAPLAGTPRKEPEKQRVMLAERPSKGIVLSPFRDDKGA